jgi:hypothetical protein
MEKLIEAIVLIADQANFNGDIFTEDALKKMANDHPEKYRYDEKTKQLLFRGLVDVKSP